MGLKGGSNGGGAARFTGFRMFVNDIFSLSKECMHRRGCLVSELKDAVPYSPTACREGIATYTKDGHRECGSCRIQGGGCDRLSWHLVMMTTR